MRSVLFLLCFSMSSFVWAADAAQLRFLGFTEKGDYLSFQQFGQEDGSGTLYAIIYFLDVAKNDYALPPIKTTLTEDEQAALGKDITVEGVVALNLKAAEESLKKLNINPKVVNTGIHSISHPLTDISADRHQVRFSLDTVYTGLPPVQTYKLQLQLKKGTAECYGIGDSQMFSLSLTDEAKDKTRILQKDKKVPKSRGCPLNYRLQDVYVYKEKMVVVFINMFQLGFEGQNMRYLAVSGSL